MASSLRIGQDSRTLSGRLSTGQPFPRLTLEDSKQRTCILPSGPSLIVFYRGHWCDHCRDQLVGLADQHVAFKSVGVSVVAISTDGPEGCREIVNVTGNAFPVLIDTDARVTRELDLIDPFELRPVSVARPAVFLVDELGIVRYHYIGRAPEDRPRAELLLLAAEQMTRRK